MNRRHFHRAVSPVPHPPTPRWGNERARRPGDEANGIASANPGHPAPTVVHAPSAYAISG
ncbi:MAG: hypothetical protein KC423_11785 [Anaerolineales bacterium]|nr:hypothetical protein [Anaerolineales bacterium]